MCVDLLDNPKTIYIGLADLLFAYFYDHRSNEGEPTVESTWTMGKVSALCSFLQHYTSLNQAMVACSRRALAYPLYRHMKLVRACWNDVAVLLKFGRKGVLKVLMEMRTLFHQHDTHHVMVHLWLNDYCLWIQRASDDALKSMGKWIRSNRPDVDDLEWNLEGLEDVIEAAREELE
jgi:protein SHQ1